MNGFTPSNEDLRDAWREVRPGRSCDEARAEFNRWIAARDQGIRDSVKPPDLTAREHLEAVWGAAYPMPDGRDVPAGVPFIVRWKDGDFWAYLTGSAAGSGVGGEIRTLDPLPPVIPDDCMAVWASTRKDESRRVWVRATGSMAGLPDKWGVWDDGNRDADYALTRELIDPVPVPEEER